MTTSSSTTPAPEAPLTSVAVLGARGRMGVEVCRAVNEAEDLELVAMVEGSEWLFNVADGGAQVAVDFTRPESVMENIRFCIDQGIHCVVGTSGFDEAKIATVREWLAPKPDLGVLIAPNFGIGAVLLMKFAAEASRFFSSVEVVELHHPAKVDAPSGTATRTAQLIGEARRAAGVAPAPDATQAEASLPGCPRGRRRRRAGARGPPRRVGRARGGAAGYPGGDADDAARLLRPGLLHAGGAAGRPRDPAAPGSDHRHRLAARALTARQGGAQRVRSPATTPAATHRPDVTCVVDGTGLGTG